MGATMRRFGPAAAVAAVALAATPAWAASTTSTTTPTSANGPAPICVGSGTARHCSLWGVRDPWAGAPIRTAQFIPDRAQPTVKAYAAWIDTSRTDLALYPGYKGPGPTSLSRGPMEVPLTARSSLLATFNSGFYEVDSAGGFYTNHLLYDPMIAGLATVVRYRDGTVDVMTWRGGATPPADVVMARQNLTMLVAGGRPTASVADAALWGVTLSGAPAVWRTALGVTSAGDLVYAAAASQTAASLAQIMVDLHCVRAMQLDINPEWPIFVTYGARGAQVPVLYVPNPNQIPGRFLYPSTKDFFAVFVQRHPGEAQPW
ncbi:MAG: phosphodiester glycosidase family protein [Acidimicrobiales bacterium]